MNRRPGRNRPSVRGLRGLAVSLAGALLFLAAGAGAASRPAVEQEKIDWMLARVRTSDAIFLRNGAEYDGGQAASHLRRKLFFAGSRVQTAREFITGIATRSEESGQPYGIRPKGAASATPLADWLLSRLIEHEKTLAPAAGNALAPSPRP